MKTLSRDGGNAETRHITFIVTKDCQLACKYCYLVGKNNNGRMDFGIAKRMIDYLLSSPDEFPESNIVLDFIGGEPFIEIDLIDRICDYFKRESYKAGHRWFDTYMINVSTNGINYGSDAVQKFIEKNHRHLSIGITIDGTRQKHDLNRVWKGGGDVGSYDSVVANIPLWLKQFPNASTKVTVSSEDLAYVKESVLHLFSLGIHEVNINCVFEDVWREGDDQIFEEQLLELADEIIAKKLYEDYVCSFFNEKIGRPIKDSDNSNWCGCGRMIAVDNTGSLYPCTRFTAFSLRAKAPIIIGNVYDGIDRNLQRPFTVLDRISQSPQKCLECEISTGCAWCQGENYDAARTDTIFQRATAICKMHHARVRANNYYWNKLRNTL